MIQIEKSGDSHRSAIFLDKSRLKLLVPFVWSLFFCLPSQAIQFHELVPEVRLSAKDLGETMRLVAKDLSRFKTVRSLIEESSKSDKISFDLLKKLDSKKLAEPIGFSSLHPGKLNVRIGKVEMTVSILDAILDMKTKDLSFNYRINKCNTYEFSTKLMEFMSEEDISNCLGSPDSHVNMAPSAAIYARLLFGLKANAALPFIGYAAYAVGGSVLRFAVQRAGPYIVRAGVATGNKLASTALSVNEMVAAGCTAFLNAMQSPVVSAALSLHPEGSKIKEEFSCANGVMNAAKGSKDGATGRNTQVALQSSSGVNARAATEQAAKLLLGIIGQYGSSIPPNVAKALPALPGESSGFVGASRYANAFLTRACPASIAIQAARSEASQARGTATKAVAAARSLFKSYRACKSNGDGGNDERAETVVLGTERIANGSPALAAREPSREKSQQ